MDLEASCKCAKEQAAMNMQRLREQLDSDHAQECNQLMKEIEAANQRTASALQDCHMQLAIAERRAHAEVEAVKIQLPTVDEHHQVHSVTVACMPSMPSNLQSNLIVCTGCRQGGQF